MQLAGARIGKKKRICVHRESVFFLWARLEQFASQFGSGD
jgi:hypothetical protein